MKKIGDLIPVGKTTLLHGRSGSGKTLSLLKYLIDNGETPCYIDFDTNDEYDSMALEHIDGFKLIDHIKTNGTVILDELKNKVIVIDTYAMANGYIEQELSDKLENFIKKLISLKSTVIVIAHTTYFSGKPAEPNVDIVFANHVACKLHLHNDVKKTKTDIYLEVEKLRGMDSKIINDWMR